MNSQGVHHGQHGPAVERCRKRHVSEWNSTAALACQGLQRCIGVAVATMRSARRIEQMVDVVTMSAAMQRIRQDLADNLFMLPACCAASGALPPSAGAARLAICSADAMLMPCAAKCAPCVLATVRGSRSRLQQLGLRRLVVLATAMRW